MFPIKTIIRVHTFLTSAVCLFSHGNCSELPQHTRNMNVLALSDSLERSEQRLEDFFWTGSGDGPPAPLDPPAPSPVLPATLIRTTTVLATVYLENAAPPPQPVTDRSTGDCILNCEPTGYPESLQPEEASVPDDRRYWLLTVIRGGKPDALQLRLARLYQKAFLRSVPHLQQERHLGIVKSLDAPTTRKKHEVHSFSMNNSKGTPSDVSHRYHNIQSSMALTPEHHSKSGIYPISSAITPDLNMTLTLSDISPSIAQFTINTSEFETVAEIRATSLSEVEDMWILATPDIELVKREIVSDKEEMIDEEYGEKLLEIPLEEETNNVTAVFKREIIKPEQQPPVQVYIQNVTESAEQNVEIVYVVLVGGRAVPAAVAARDMRLVRDAEVASELGYPVTTKAEPYLKAAEGLEGAAGSSSGPRGNELWALVAGALAAAVLLLVLLALLCRLLRRKKSLSSAALHSYRSELLKQAERDQLKQVHEEKDGRLISVVSPSRARPTSSILPVYRADSSPSSSTSSGVSEVAAALRRRQRRGQRAGNKGGLRLPHKRRQNHVGTTDSLLASAGLSETSSVESVRGPSAPATPTSYLSMPSVKSFPRGNAVEPLNRVLEPVSVRHLDFDSPIHSPKHKADLSKQKNQRTTDKKGTDHSDVVPRRQMASQLVRLGSMDKDPGVIGPLVWDLHCQRIKEMPKPDSTRPAVKDAGNISRMRQRFNELVDDAFSLFGSPGSSPKSRDHSNGTYTLEETAKKEQPELTQARNDNVRLPGSPYTALDTIRGRSASVRPTTSVTFSQQPVLEGGRPRTSLPKHPILEKRLPPTRAWDTPSPQITSMGAIPRQPVVNPALILAQGRLPPTDPALPLISAIKSEIQRISPAREHSTRLLGKSEDAFEINGELAAE